MRLVDKLPEKPKAENTKKYRSMYFKLTNTDGDILYTSDFYGYCQEHRRKLGGSVNTMPIEHGYRSV